MRIAILAPISRRIPPRPYGPEEQLISDLTEGLLELGHQVTLFAAGNSLTRAELAAVCPRPLVEWEEDPWPDPRWWEEMHVSECLTRASRGDFDIVHNHMGAKALPFLVTLKVPVVTTLHGGARDKQHQTILRRFKDYPYVAMSEDEKALLPELNYVQVIPPPNPEDSAALMPVLIAYQTLYQGLVSGEIPSLVSEIKRLTPWGGWEVLLDEPAYKVKRIVVNPGHRLSYQRHFKRREHWIVVMGRAEVVLGGKTIALDAGQAVDIPAGTDHRIGNQGSEPLVFIEVQQGTYFGEDDIERLEDDYGRK
jgi:mannose-6-phosphate isomerase-like protein (cupin superfamily)